MPPPPTPISSTPTSTRGVPHPHPRPLPPLPCPPPYRWLLFLRCMCIGAGARRTPSSGLYRCAYVASLFDRCRTRSSDCFGRRILPHSFPSRQHLGRAANCPVALPPPHPLPIPHPYCLPHALLRSSHPRRRLLHHLRPPPYPSPFRWLLFLRWMYIGAGARRTPSSGLYRCAYVASLFDRCRTRSSDCFGRWILPHSFPSRQHRERAVSCPVPLPLPCSPPPPRPCLLPHTYPRSLCPCHLLLPHPHPPPFPEPLYFRPSRI